MPAFCASLTRPFRSDGSARDVAIARASKPLCALLKWLMTLPSSVITRTCAACGSFARFAYAPERRSTTKSVIEVSAGSSTGFHTVRREPSAGSVLPPDSRYAGIGSPACAMPNSADATASLRCARSFSVLVSVVTSSAS